MSTSSLPGWQASEPALRERVNELRRRILDVYRTDPLLVEEHAGQEDSFRTGGYAARQVLELIQNAADALHRAGVRGRVEVRLTDSALYCANEGAPFSEDGLDAVSHAYLSPKREAEIGRFGLGFKSVLGVSTEPTVFSRSVSFGFSARRAREAIATLAPEATSFPVLRVPFEVDAAAEFLIDPVLAELAEWAVTIVRLPLTGAVEALSTDLHEFRREFLLFARNVERLRIGFADSDSPKTVDYECTAAADHLSTLIGGNLPDADWLVFDRVHRPSEDALAEVPEKLRRDEVRVSYAVPVDDATSLGQFWAHFPLQDTTSTRGIHNAPWQINDDRTSLLDGQFNRELLDVVADLVVENLHRLRSDDDPARHFDYMPARGREAPNVSDRYLAETIPAKARLTACVPDANGRLRKTHELSYLRSDVELDLVAYRAWAAAPERPTDSPHWTCYRTPARRARLRALLRPDDLRTNEREIGPAAWIERIAGDGRDDKVVAALKVIFAVSVDAARHQMLGARVLPDSENQLHRLTDKGELFLKGNILSADAGLRLLRPSLLEHEEVVRRLESLGFRDVDPAEELHKLATTAARKWSAGQWKGFWQLVEEVPASDAQRILVRHVASGAPLKVKCRDGLWHDVGTIVVRGVVDPTNSGLVVDDEYHELHLGLLAAVGVSTRPATSLANEQDLTYLEYVRLQRDGYLKNLPPRGRPQAASLRFVETEPLGPLHVLRRFVDSNDLDSAVTWTTELLVVDTADRWRMKNTVSRSGDASEVPAPHLWAAQRYGRLRSSWGPRLPSQCLHPNLDAVSALLPVATDQIASKLRLVGSVDDVPAGIWREFMNRPARSGADGRLLGDLLVSAAIVLPADEPLDLLPAMGVESGQSAAAELILAITDEEARALSARSLPHAEVRSEADVERLVELWGCRAASSVLRVEILTETPGQPELLLDRFRGLRAQSGGQLDAYELVSCNDLARQITGPDGIQSEATDYLRSGNTIFYVRTVSDDELLEKIASDFDLQLSATSLHRVLEDAQDASIKQKIAECRATTAVADKLLVLLPTAVLETALPSGLLDSVRRLGNDTGPTQIAELLLHVHGYSVLIELRHALESAGYAVPERWAGSAPAIAFVRSLGLPREYAGVRGSSLDADTTVLGPPGLEPLHDFQEALAREIRELVAVGATPERALLVLPTGAGKTRVTVEALSKAFIEDGLTGTLLWIAQSEELCEQAVQTWSVVWREFGNQPLRLCRLWSRNEVASTDDAVTVVVATDAKLDVCRDRDEYDWLRDASAVVIDEAHTATESGMDATLRWLGLGTGQTSRPLLGLTATAFKSNEEATRRFVNRFGRRKLNSLGDDPYGELQRRGVLARIEHKQLNGTNVELDDDEVRQLSTFRLVPQAVLERVGRDEERTSRLLEHIVELPSDWPVLVFTASVLSAQVLAALLRVRGISAASVSGNTPIYDRRRSIDAFRRRDLQVLTNCNVLTTGFDAPSVRALYIARPTFSPNAYIQMVGRGLRGPANGGKSECLVVNVADTFDRFGDKLAYTEFDYLWDAKGRGQS